MQVPPVFEVVKSLLIPLAIAVVGWVGTFLFFARFRARIVYWL